MVPWRQAASLLLLANRQRGKSLFDYSTLLLKRSPKLRFAPNTSTFPGGKLDPCDLSLEWLKYFSPSIDINRYAKRKADIYQDIDHPYPGLVFRLCAIRETFEETGLLLVKPKISESVQHRHATIYNLSDSSIHEWRNRIRNDASQFMTMCKEIQMEPDVHSLFEWSQFLGAAIAKVRFDTIFYIATLPNVHSCSIAPDDHETASADWFEPDVAMNGYYENSIDFLPPQVYDLSRLANFRKLSHLIEFLLKCENNPEHRIERLLGICYKIPEAILLMMPGDEHYPADASFTTPILSSNQTLKNFDSNKQNRLIMMNTKNDRKWKIYCKGGNDNEKNSLNIIPLSFGWEKP